VKILKRGIDTSEKVKKLRRKNRRQMESKGVNIC
jgi:hypothetical protein